MFNKVAVIILNYNSFNDCRKCVSFLKRQEDVELELVLVDNCSQDGDKVKALCREQGCTFIASPKNQGYNAGNNIGLRYAASKGYQYAMIANPDMEFPQTDYVKKLVEAMNKDDDVVVVGSDIIGVDGSHQSPLQRQHNWASSFNWVKIVTNPKLSKMIALDDYKKSHCCWKVSGCCLMVRMAFMKSIGFFDESLFLYCEESVLAEQVIKANKKIYYVATAQAIHYHVPSTKGNPIIRMKQWERSRLYFVHRYSGDSWLGKQIACLSIRLYVILFILAKRKNI